MIRSGHFALNRIEIAHNDLLEELVQIKRMAKERRLRLQDAVESQTVINCLFFVLLNLIF